MLKRVRGEGVAVRLLAAMALACSLVPVAAMPRAFAEEAIQESGLVSEIQTQGEKLLGVSKNALSIQAFDRVVMVGHGRTDQGWGFVPVVQETSVGSRAVGSTPFLIDAAGGELDASIASVVSSNPSIVKIFDATSGDSKTMAYEAVGVGSTTLVLTDAIGREYTSTITVLSKQDYLASYVRFKSDALTMSVGDSIENGTPVGATPVNDLLVCGTDYFGSDFTAIVIESSDESIVECLNAPVTLAITAKASGDAELRLYCIDDTRTPEKRTLCDTIKVRVGSRTIASTDSGSNLVANVEANDSLTIDVLNSHASNGLNLVVRPQSSLTLKAQQAIDSLASNGGQVVEALDVHFSNNDGARIDVSNPLSVTVRINLGDEMAKFIASSLKVHYVGDDGDVESKNTWVENGQLCFSTEHFSTYVITGVPVTPESNEQNTQTGGEKEAVENESAASDLKPLDKTSISTAAKLASTGDTNALAFAGAAMLFSFGVACLAGLLRRRTC